ncbi:transcriptional regulator, TetR family [Candidatus Vecturithrix granuli]|uniref:Transcriptional regulator, TetR family n=1 Tax=Vecturithrix granuli TaxID=1499967 RepID=A0A081C664_VECG1|nr:transcriptional regulator, TetR family [Candidatus Vecturithrix granuli]
MNQNNQKTDKKVAILEATMELVAEQGFDHTPTSQIAEKAKVGIGTIYRYFKDKDELIHEVFRYILERENLDTFKDFHPESPIRQQYIQYCTRLIDYSLQHLQEFKFIQHYFHSPYGLSHRQEKIYNTKVNSADESPLIRLFEIARTQQIVKDLPSFVLGALTIGPIIWLLRDIHSGLIPYNPEMMRSVVEACWDAVKR